MIRPARACSALALAATAATAACDGPPSEAVKPIADGQIALVRQVGWPGGGAELTIRVQAEDGGPIAADLSGAIRIEWEGGAEPEVQIGRAPLDTGYTAVLVLPAADGAGRQQLAAALDRYAAARPAGERIAIYAWGASVHQVGNFTARRGRIGDLAQRLGALEPADEPMEVGEAIRAVEQEVLRLGGPAPRASRAVVVLGYEEPRPSLDGLTVPVIFAGGSGASVEEAAAAIDEHAATSLYQIAVCGPPDGAIGHLAIEGLRGELTVALPPALPEERLAPCDPGAIAAGERSFPSAIELVFSPEERAVHEDRVASLSRADFELGVRLWPGTEPVRATAHLRGRGTFACERKSYTVDLEGARHLFPGSRTDEIYLLSMCADNRYIEQYTANQILEELGLLPLRFRYVELLIDGETRGVYLMLEKAKEELVRDNARVRSVMRRRFSAPDDYLEVDYAPDGEGAAVDAFDAYLAGLDGLAGEELERAAGGRLDLELYLRWIALMSAFQNGDYVDELWIFSSEGVDPAGEVGDWFEPMAWDNDDLFSECHYGGQYAMADPHGLLYCAESSLDRRLLADSALYGRFVDILEELLVDLVPPERFSAAVEATAAEILPYFERPEICAAMVRLIESNPAARDPEEAQRDIRARLDELAASYAARRALLLERIAAYRAGT